MTLIKTVQHPQQISLPLSPTFPTQARKYPLSQAPTLLCVLWCLERLNDKVAYRMTQKPEYIKSKHQPLINNSAPMAAGTPTVLAIAVYPVGTGSP